MKGINEQNKSSILSEHYGVTEGLLDDAYIGIDMASGPDRTVVCKFDERGECLTHFDCIHDNREVNFL